MKLSYVDLCGFRSYRQRTRIDFAPGFTVIDGRNGAGKSTLFDAVEYALTGTIHKYLGATAKNQTVDDYVWWTGEGDSPSERFVEVGFIDDSGEPFSIRRTEFGGVPRSKEDELVRKLTVFGVAPEDPLRQLCNVALIRDEHIAEFSLDLKEADRYALLREALGATDADQWIAKGFATEKATKGAVAEAEAELKSLRQSRDAALQRVDEARQSRRSDSALKEATERLQAFSETSSSSDDALVSLVREKMSEMEGKIEALRALRGKWPDAAGLVARLPILDGRVASAKDETRDARAFLEGLGLPLAQPSTEAATRARELAELVELGRRVGLRGSECPLCGCSHDLTSFERGLVAAQKAALELNAVAVERAAREQERAQAEARLLVATRALQLAEQEFGSAQAFLSAFEGERDALGLDAEAEDEDVRSKIVELEEGVARAAVDLRTLRTLEYDTVVQREERRAETATNQLEVAEKAAGKTRRAAATAKALHAAAIRAAGETLDERLARVQPLMSELYKRLNPHPVWKELDYSIRGDVRRFMTLQVGGQHNPQFIFSSGQRRATGLAFLLSVNLSLAWSRWKTILLDDPVQHVDDFRAVHLAEVMGQFVREGRQIICAVEDAALADLLTRRLPNEYLGAARRVTLRLEPDGSSSAALPRTIPPLPRHSITNSPNRQMAG